MSKTKKLLLLIFVTFVINLPLGVLFNTLLVQKFFLWFIATSFVITPITFIQSMGIILFLGILRKTNKKPKWKLLNIKKEEVDVHLDKELMDSKYVFFKNIVFYPLLIGIGYIFKLLFF
jgi:predicted membrane protein